jgi:EAL domain-containing protein (putative c-di-GMP-specific phosphodiesterase class I)
MPWTARIHEALRAGPRMVFQPIFLLDEDPSRIFCYEALARFPDGPPDQYFRAAAQLQLGLELELAAFDAAVAALPDIPDGILLGVNVSPSTVLSRALIERMLDLDCERIVLEISEKEQVHDYEALLAALDQVRFEGAKICTNLDIGEPVFDDEDAIRIAVDDFGTGYASIRRVMALRPDDVKLDASIIRNIDRLKPLQALCAGLTVFSEHLGIRLVAEGVETQEELDTLMGLGVCAAQGYLLGRPGPLPS